MTEHGSKGVSADYSESTAPEEKERAGKLLKREREKRQLSIETVAQRLRLNAKYIEALEESHYDQLHGDTYIRVYLKSLAKFLSLDPEEILKRFFEERGLTADEKQKKDRSSQLTLSQIEDKKRSSPMILVAVCIVIFLAVIAFIVKKHGVLLHRSGPAVSVVDTTAKAAPPAEKTGAAAAEAGDSVQKSAEVAVPSQTSVTPAKPSVEAHTPQTAGSVNATGSRPIPPGNLLMLKITSNDSCWARVYCDGKQWRKILTKGQDISFTAQDSFNIFLGQSKSVTLALNGRPIDNPTKKGVSSMKIDHSGVSWWTIDKWKAVFH